MIVNRIIWGLKKGCGAEAAALIKDEYLAEKARGGYSGPCRLYIREMDDGDEISLEYEYTDMAACEASWRVWTQRPTTPEYFKKWRTLREGKEINEYWTIPA